MLKYIILLCCCGSVLCELLGKRLGNNCAWEERAGKCVPLHQCRSAMEDIRQNNPPPICAFEGINPVICCTDCNLVDDTRKLIIDPELGKLNKVGTKAEDQCFKYLKTWDYPCKKNYNFTSTKNLKGSQGNCSMFTDSYKILVNNDTLINTTLKSFPHMAYLGYGESMDKADWLCGGAVISERFILTAAECVQLSDSTGTVRFVALGIHKRWVSPTEWQRYNVKRAIPHPEYKAPSKYHDIALLETDKKIIFGTNVLPACIDSENKKIKDYATFNLQTTVTWSEGKNSTLDSATLTSFDELLCSIFYPPQKTLADGYNHTTQMCLGNREKPKDSCDGEIGSPLQSSFITCFQLIEGVASFKRQCGEAGGSGLFTRVSHYRPWIEGIVWP